MIVNVHACVCVRVYVRACVCMYICMHQLTPDRVLEPRARAGMHTHVHALGDLLYIHMFK